MPDKISRKLEKELNKFRHNHYKNADFKNWNAKTISLHRKFNNLKDKNKQNRAVLDLYLLYLQSMEVLFINAHAASVKLNKFPSALFIASHNLRKFIENNFSKSTKFSHWFFTNYIFFIQGTDKDKKQRFQLYTNLIKECADDYLKNYDLLNAYKHGFRVNAKFDKTILSIVSKDGKQYKLNESDSTITYFSKEDNVVYEHSLNFKVGRVFSKTIFICTLLNNIKSTVLYSYKDKLKGKRVARFYIDDKNRWDASFGRSHFKKPVFSLMKK